MEQWINIIFGFNNSKYTLGEGYWRYEHTKKKSKCVGVCLSLSRTIV
jgi:hypothetical protein